MRNKIVLLLFFITASNIITANIYLSAPIIQRENEDVIIADGIIWKPVLNWDFHKGHFPNSWYWGNWSVGNDGLQGMNFGSNIHCNCSVYFLPFKHKSNFFLETKLIFLAGMEDDVEAHLLTRDNKFIFTESGKTVYANDGKMTLRHRTKGSDFIFKNIYTNIPLNYHEWYTIGYMVFEGNIKTFVNDVQVYSLTGSYPLGEYNEPHLAVKRGIVRFEFFKIYETFN